MWETGKQCNASGSGADAPSKPLRARRLNTRLRVCRGRGA